MSSSQPSSQPENTNQSATIHKATQEPSRFRNVHGLIEERNNLGVFDVDVVEPSVPGDVGLSGGTLVKNEEPKGVCRVRAVR